MAINLHILWDWKHKLLKIVHIFEYGTVIVSVLTTKTWICEHGEDLHIPIMCSVYRHIVFLQSDIAHYWPGMNNAAVSVIVWRILVKGERFDNIVIYMQNFSEMQKKNISIFSTPLLCQRTF